VSLRPRIPHLSGCSCMRCRFSRFIELLPDVVAVVVVLHQLSTFVAPSCRSWPSRSLLPRLLRVVDRLLIGCSLQSSGSIATRIPRR